MMFKVDIGGRIRLTPNYFSLHHTMSPDSSLVYDLCTVFHRTFLLSTEEGCFISGGKAAALQRCVVDAGRGRAAWSRPGAGTGALMGMVTWPRQGQECQGVQQPHRPD